MLIKGPEVPFTRIGWLTFTILAYFQQGERNCASTVPLDSVVPLGGLRGNTAQGLRPWETGQGRVMKNPFSLRFNLEHLRTTWMQETKFTPAFKREENQGFRSSLLQSASTSLPGLFCRTALPPVCGDPGPGRRADTVLRTPGRYPPAAVSSR